MLDHNETMSLIKMVKAGDNEAAARLLEHNSFLLKSLIVRYKNRGVEYDDLYQLACLGFIKAINNFNDIFEVKFSTYVVPMVLGEIKRFFRDDGYIKVSRSIKADALKIRQYVEEFKSSSKNNVEPTTLEISEKFNIEQTDVAFIMDSVRMPVSLFEKVGNSADSQQMIIDKIESKDKEDDLVDKIMLKNSIKLLTDREKKIVILRYFRDKTQGEIAEYFGVSQVQISRIESKIIEKLKKNFKES